MVKMFRPGTDKWLWLMAFILLLAGFLQSCSTLEKRIGKAKLVAYENPASFSEFCAQIYPAKEKYIKGRDSIRVDTITIKGDSVVCPPTVNSKGDTLYVKVKCPDVKTLTKYINRVDTIEKIDSARVFTLSNKLSDLQASFTAEKKDKEEWQSKAQSRWWWNIGLGLALAVLVFLWLRIKFTL